MATSSTLPPTTNGKLPRVDGPLKVTGAAKYSSDYNLPGMLYAVPVCATIASGTIASLDVSRAEAMPGVNAVYHRANTSGSSFAPRRPQVFPALWTRSGLHLKTTRCATTGNTWRLLWR